MSVTLSPVAPRDLKAELAARPDAVVLDVRTPGEFETEHIAGSYNVPLDLLQEHADEVAARLDGTAVLVCQSGSRAGTAQDRLESSAATITAGVLVGLGAATTFLINAIVTLVLSFFFLKDGDRFLPWFGGVLGPRTGMHVV